MNKYSFNLNIIAWDDLYDHLNKKCSYYYDEDIYF